MGPALRMRAMQARRVPSAQPSRASVARSSLPMGASRSPPATTAIGSAPHTPERQPALMGAPQSSSASSRVWPLRMGVFMPVGSMQSSAGCGGASAGAAAAASFSGGAATGALRAASFGPRCSRIVSMTIGASREPSRTPLRSSRRRNRRSTCSDRAIHVRLAMIVRPRSVATTSGAMAMPLRLLKVLTTSGAVNQ
ncbi:hypothetical protein D9M69_485480 [compost metagenome]